MANQWRAPTHKPWIFCQRYLSKTKEAITIAIELGIEPQTVAGTMLDVWSAFDEHIGEDTHPAAFLVAFIDQHAGRPGFAMAMAKTPWLRIAGETATIPEFDKWFGKSAKRRRLDALRKQVTEPGIFNPET